jgi:hypothetical protein
VCLVTPLLTEKEIILMRNLLISMIVVAVFALSAMAQGAAPAKEKPAKPAKVAAAPKSDAEVAKCINDKFAASSAIKNGKASVSGGVATLTGDVNSGGAKGGQTVAAKSCGATSVTNNITVAPKAPKAEKAPAAKPAAPAAAPAKKP